MKVYDESSRRQLRYGARLLGIVVAMATGLGFLIHSMSKEKAKEQAAFDQEISAQLTGEGFQIKDKNIDCGCGGVTNGVYSLQRHDSLFNATAARKKIDGVSVTQITEIKFIGKKIPAVSVQQ